MWSRSARTCACPSPPCCTSGLARMSSADRSRTFGRRSGREVYAGQRRRPRTRHRSGLTHSGARTVFVDHSSIGSLVHKHSADQEPTYVRHPVASQSVAHNRRQLTATIETSDKVDDTFHSQPSLGSAPPNVRRQRVSQIHDRHCSYALEGPLQLPPSHRTHDALLCCLLCLISVNVLATFPTPSPHQLDHVRVGPPPTSVPKPCTATSTRFSYSTISRARREDGVAGQSFLLKKRHSHTHTHTHFRLWPDAEL
jgi:hypothetical protein